MSVLRGKEDVLIQREMLAESNLAAVDELEMAINKEDNPSIKLLLAQLTDEWQRLEATHEELYPLLTNLEERRAELKWFINHRMLAVRTTIRAEECLAGYVQEEPQNSVIIPVSSIAKSLQDPVAIKNVHPVSIESVNSQALAGIESVKVLLPSDAGEEFVSYNLKELNAEAVADNGTLLSSQVTEVKASLSTVNQDPHTISSLNLPQLVIVKVGKAASAVHPLPEAGSAASADSKPSGASPASITSQTQEIIMAAQPGASLFHRKKTSSEAPVNSYNHWGVEPKTPSLQLHGQLNLVAKSSRASLPKWVSKLYFSSTLKYFLSVDQLVRVTAQVLPFLSRIQKRRQHSLPSASMKATESRSKPIQLVHDTTTTVKEISSAQDEDWIYPVQLHSSLQKWDGLQQLHHKHQSTSIGFHPSWNDSNHLIHLNRNIQLLMSGGYNPPLILLPDSVVDSGVSKQNIRQQFIFSRLINCVQHFQIPAASLPAKHTSDPTSVKVLTFNPAGSHLLQQRYTADRKGAYQRSSSSQLNSNVSTVITTKSSQNQVVLHQVSTFNVNQAVVIQDANLERNQWPTAIIQHLIPGKDGVIRIAILRTITGAILNRPVHQLYPLEVNPEEDSMDEESTTTPPVQSVPVVPNPASLRADLIHFSCINPNSISVIPISVITKVRPPSASARAPQCVGTSFQQLSVNNWTSRRMSQSAVSLQHLRHPRGREPTIHPEGKRRRARRLDSHKNISIEYQLSRTAGSSRELQQEQYQSKCPTSRNTGSIQRELQSSQPFRPFRGTRSEEPSHWKLL